MWGGCLRARGRKWRARRGGGVSRGGGGVVRVGYVGRLSPRKGPQVAVAAVDELLRRGVDARLRVAGSVFPGYEWFEAELREQVRLAGLDNRVEFLGFVPDPWQVFADSDVVV